VETRILILFLKSVLLVVMLCVASGCGLLGQQVAPVDDAEIPPNSIDENTLTMPSPPRTAPTAF